MVFKNFKASEPIVQMKSSGRPVCNTEEGKLLILPDPKAVPPKPPGFTGRVSKPHTLYVIIEDTRARKIT